MKRDERPGSRPPTRSPASSVHDAAAILGRVARAVDALDDGELGLARQLLADLEDDLAGLREAA